MDKLNSVSVVLPSKNEGESLSAILPQISQLLPEAEIIVVNDGSTDNTVDICKKHNVRVITHAYSMGNGAAIKSGARAAQGDILVCLDADGQHDPEDIPRLVDKLREGYDMVIGARSSLSQASLGRSIANMLYNRLAGWMVNHHVADLTSGFRAAKTEKFREFLYLLPNGFSYPTTITMSFFRAGYTVGYTPIHALKRRGKSHIKPVKDGVRFFLIIFKISTLYSPLKLFFPISFLFFVIGISYYGYTFLHYQRFTNMSALFLIASMLIFLIGLVSEQITSLLYSQRNDQ